ncbi:hypothetical protein F2Q68_00015236 [Brassica cretica]|uniref:Uncharacterized protein n=1 Tax=Brassica cretica TaxID=69181 RepID=A0A8S9H8D9_BRACR|nr:hypothetical protein F2Q68_00015236 [Brassica cretica]
MVLIFYSFKGFSDLRLTLKDFSVDSRKTSRQAFNAFYARRPPTKSSGSLLPKVTLEDFSEDSWKTLRNSRKTLDRLLEKSSNVFYARRLPTKSSGSLPNSSAQSGTME